MKTPLRIAVVGCGGRGTGLLKAVMIPMQQDGDFEITTVCDLYEDRVLNAADCVEKECGKRPYVTMDYREAVTRPDVDAVVIPSAWEAHVDVAIAAMEAGHFAAMEVGGAYTLEDCWSLVHTSERTGVPCMLLENCCYGKRELMVLNMVRQGVMGEIVHCEGGYHHDLRSEISGGEKNRHYRLRNYLNRNCENYPTHELGPIAKLLNINNGNRMLTLTSIASCAKGLNTYVKDRFGEDDPLATATFRQGDVVTTTITCAGGQTIVLTLDTTLPRTYSRGFTVRGTLGAYFEDNDSIYLDRVHEEYEFRGRGLWGNAKEYEEQYLHPLWQNYDPRGGHDGMDWMVFHAFLEAARDGKRPPIDVYDAAAWMSITALSEKSISLGGQVVEIPDFTRGKWHMRRDIEPLYYGLDILR